VGPNKKTTLRYDSEPASNNNVPTERTMTDPAENRFELLIQSITDYAIYQLDTKGIVSSWNAGARRFKGYLPEEIIGHHFSRFYTEEDRADNLPMRALLVAEQEGRFEAEGWRVRKDGTRFWASVVIDPVRDSTGNLVGFAKITRDLTEKHAAEEVLRLSEERFRLLVESVTDYAIYMLDPNGIVSSWNAGAKYTKGYLADEIIGQHFSRFYTEEDRAANLPQRALRIAERRGGFEAEGWRCRKDGSRFWANVVIRPVRNSSGKLLGFAKVTRDLSERREAQLTLEKAQNAFFQSQKMDALGKLTGGMAHDFNNLLAAIIGGLELAKRRLPEDASAVRFIDNAIQAAERGATLTQRLLTFARKQELALASVDVIDLVRGMSDLIQRTIGSGVSVETSFPPVLESVRADAGQLELAILNLAVNARDAMPNGGCITISAGHEQIDGTHTSGLPVGAYVWLSVNDTGVGMDPETLAHATEPFYTTKGIGKGTGLGLSMVHGFVEQCGGALSLGSQPGKGTTATFWLPVAQPGKAEEGRSAPAEESKSAADALLILAVDDDELVLTNTVAMLEEMGHRVLHATSGAQAVEILAMHPIELLITDYAMPGMTGLQLAQAAQAGQPGLPVVLVSGYADMNRQDAVSLPKLSKPFRQAELNQLIQQAVAPRL
jgi:PAS domain S-box-containing protein